MRIIASIIIYIALLLGCGTKTQIPSKVPVISEPSQDSLAVGYIPELTQPEVDINSPLHGWASPDGMYRLLVKRENSSEELAGFYSVRLQEDHSDTGRTLFTMWDADVGSGSAIGAKWSKDSKAIRLKGRTRGFEYKQKSGEAREFDFIYFVEDDRLFSVAAEAGHLGK